MARLRRPAVDHAAQERRLHLARYFACVALSPVSWPGLEHDAEIARVRERVARMTPAALLRAAAKSEHPAWRKVRQTLKETAA